MNLSVTTIDPVVARSMLSKNGKNRRVSQRHIDRLAAEMSGGHWVLNGQTISFSKEGLLLDGQHRLHAVVKSGVTIPMTVVYGVEDDRAFQTYDQTALKRGLNQIVDMKGYDNANTLTAVARRLELWESTSNKDEFSLLRKAWQEQTGHAVIEYVDAHAAEIRQIYNAVKCSLPYRKCRAGSSLIAMLVVCNRVDDVAGLLFIDGLKTGAGLAERSPVRMLREKLIDPPRKSGLAWDTEVMALTAKAFNKFLTGKSLRFLRWRQEGDYPEKFPVPGDVQWK